MTKEKHEEDILFKEDTPDKRQIIVQSGDVNTFQWVIQSLVEVCDHDPLQAEQCAMMVHYNGKCDVKSGSYEELESKCLDLLERKISAKIE